MPVFPSIAECLSRNTSREKPRRPRPPLARVPLVLRAAQLPSETKTLPDPEVVGHVAGAGREMRLRELSECEAAACAAWQSSVDDELHLDAQFASGESRA